MENTTVDPITAFETDTNKLISSIQHYKPSVEFANAIINDQDKIGEEISSLRNTTQSYRDYDTSVQLYDNKLTSQLKESLSILVECKRSLDNLPKLGPKRPSDDLNEEDTKTILSYALKLSKFSKIPRTFDGFLLPNNFIWPGDDNMRRGNLAIASLIPEKIINIENYGTDYVPPVENNDSSKIEKDTDTKMNDDDDDSEDEFLPERTNVVTQSNRNDKTAVISGLDLLDSDDE
ncbi:hypothetical protein CANINC_002596 [Pichia inconspicua]|uniref:Mediator of RNA polymerase II transcription subunit 4 n=1 Tax=Pichia inconspicua TaxID=52247 RepID=A0A4T0X181_9ASCO|nr:hypothetical protein CANINC_002596 [[Candida] inconspicua]